MQNLFLTEDDVFYIKIFVAEDDEGIMYCDLDEKGVKFLLGDKNAEIIGYTVTFKKPSFGDMKELTDILLFKTDNENESFSYDTNPITAKIKTMAFLIRDWDFKDSSGEKILPTEENIMKLNPLIATSISIQLEDYLRAKDIEENIQEESE